MAGAGGIRAGKAFVELAANDGPLQKGLAAASMKLQAWGAAVSAMGVGITRPLEVLGGLFAGRGRELIHLAEETGSTVEEIQALGFAARRAGADGQSLEYSLVRMNRLIYEAGQGSHGAIEKLDQLGLSYEQLAPLSETDRLAALADGIQRTGDVSGATMSLLGRRAMHLIPLLTRGAEGIRALTAEAYQRPDIISTEEAEQARAFGFELRAIGNAINNATMLIAGGLVPGLREAFAGDKNIATLMTQAARGASNWLKTNKELVKWIFNIGLYLTYAGGALFVVAKVLPPIANFLRLGKTITLLWKGAVWLLAASYGVVKTAILLCIAPAATLNAALNLNPVSLGIAAVVLALAAVAVGIGYILYQSGALGRMGRDWQVAWEGMKAAFDSGDLPGVVNMVGLAISANWARLCETLGNFWDGVWLAAIDKFFEFAGWLGPLIDRTAADFEIAWATIKGGFEVTMIDLAESAASGVGWIEDVADNMVAGLKITWAEMVADFRRAWARITNLTEAGRTAAINAINAETAAEIAGIRAANQQAQQSRADTLEQQVGDERDRVAGQIRDEIQGIVERTEAGVQAGLAGIDNFRDTLGEDAQRNIQGRREHTREATDALRIARDDALWAEAERGFPGAERFNEAAHAAALHGTFSAAAAGRLGAGGNPNRDPIRVLADRTEELHQAALRHNTLLEVLHRDMRDVIANTGGIGA